MFPWTLRRRYQHGPGCSGSLLRGPRSVQGRLGICVCGGLDPAVSELEFRGEPETLGACQLTDI